MHSTHTKAAYDQTAHDVEGEVTPRRDAGAFLKGITDCIVRFLSRHLQAIIMAKFAQGVLDANRGCRGSFAFMARAHCGRHRNFKFASGQQLPKMLFLEHCNHRHFKPLEEEHANDRLDSIDQIVLCYFICLPILQTTQLQAVRRVPSACTWIQT
jgi:hypothetical protein